MARKADPRDLVRLLGMAHDVDAFEQRLDLLSASLVGRPYVIEPLVGSPTEPETMVSRLDGFDCVTFVEAVIGLSRSRAPSDFESRLAAVRYDQGRVDWLARNHYMSLWIERNSAAGIVRRVGVGAWTGRTPVRRLGCLDGYPPLERRIDHLPVEALDTLRDRGATGDVLCFLSQRDDLDTFHVGLLVQRPAGLLLRHASRSAARVVEQPLTEFLAANETPGMLVARPLPPGGMA